MPKKLKKSKPSIMKQKQVVNINITNPKRKAKRVKSKPKTKSGNLYPSQLQSHNSGVVLPFHHQFYIPPTDKSFPQIEELTNKFRDGNLMQITQNNDLMNRLDNNQRITNQLAQSVINGKSPAKIYDLLMQEHLVRNAPKKLKHAATHALRHTVVVVCRFHGVGVCLEVSHGHERCTLFLRHGTHLVG